MPVITQAQAEQHLADWLAADTAVATGQAYTIAGRTLTRADAQVIRQNLTYWNRLVDRLSRGSIRIRGVTPV